MQVQNLKRVRSRMSASERTVQADDFSHLECNRVVSLRLVDMQMPPGIKVRVECVRNERISELLLCLKGACQKQALVKGGAERWKGKQKQWSVRCLPLFNRNVSTAPDTTSPHFSCVVLA